MSKVAELRKKLAEAEAEEKTQLATRKREYNKRVDSFIESGVKWALEMSESLSNKKESLYKEGLELDGELYTIYDRTPNYEQKSFTLQNSTKSNKIVISNAEKLTLNESSKVGIELMHEVLKNKFESRNKGMYNIIDKLLTRNSKGDYDPKLIVKLRQLESEINDPNFSKALKILTDAQEVDSTTLYIRFYYKDKLDKWKNIKIRFSSN